MKYTMEVDLNRPIGEVISLFDNSENLYKWMEGLESIEHISGTPGEVGAKSRLKFKMGKREIEMTETIIKKNLPHEFTFTYEADGVFNVVRNKFLPLPGNRTKYITGQEFKFNSFVMKIIGFLMPGSFKKQSKKHMDAFKKFAEQE